MELLVLLVSFLLLLILGLPIGFCIGLSASLTLIVAMPFQPAVTTIAQRLATGLDSFSLLAIPFFVLAGQIMNQGGIAIRLIRLAKSLVGMFPGGLAFVNIVSSMLFGAISGSAVAAASAIGGVMTPNMRKEGYPDAFSASINVTSATTGLLIPPSNILIVYSLASGGVSIAALFLAGYVPGLLVGMFLIIVAAILARQQKLKGIPFLGIRALWNAFVDSLASLFLLVLVIGGIVAGIFTATEASAIAVFYTFILAVFVYREVHFSELPALILQSVKTTSIVLFLVGTSMSLSWVMSFENIPQNVSAALLSLSDNPIVILLTINAILLFVGTFMDMTPAVLIFTPIFLPVVVGMGVDPIHFGIIMILNLCVGLCTPPVGSVLFVGCSVANVPIDRIIKPLIPFFLAMIAALIVVSLFPQLSLWLPRLFGY